MKIIQLQTKVFKDKNETLCYIEKLIDKMSAYNPDFICLPEMFNCPYENKYFPIYAESYKSKTYQFLSNLAKKYSVYICGGSFPEINNKKQIFNTAYVFNRKGKELARHAKMHLFDIDIKNGQYFKESDTLTAGNSVTVFDTEFGKMGLCICYDIRFPELFRLMVDRGAKIIFIPASFNQTTGKMHWELLFCSRAVDNQVFTVGTSPALAENSAYHSWGHSIVVSPWGKILNQLDCSQGQLITEIDLSEVTKVREQLPLLKHRRLDIYNLKYLL